LVIGIVLISSPNYTFNLVFAIFLYIYPHHNELIKTYKAYSLALELGVAYLTTVRCVAACLPLVCPGPRTVVHPKARIIAEAGPIVIGEGNLIEEQALIING